MTPSLPHRVFDLATRAVDLAAIFVMTQFALPRPRMLARLWWSLWILVMLRVLSSPAGGEIG